MRDDASLGRTALREDAQAAMRSGGLAARTYAFVLLLAVALVTTFACGDQKGALVVAVSTDMKAPKDVSAISLSVSTNGVLKFSALGRVTPLGDVLLPATLAVAEPEDRDASVRIRVMAFQDRRARVLRDVRTTVPHGGRIALLRLPLSFVNDGSVTGVLPEGVALPPVKMADGSGGGTTDALDPGMYVPNCPSPEQTWIDGECQDAAVDSSALPEYSDEKVFGAGGSATDTSTSCFDPVKCFAASVVVSERDDTGKKGALVLDRGACTIALGGVEPATLNLAIVTPDTGECLRDGACYVPLDRGPSWHDEAGIVRLTPVVCKLLGKGLRLEASTTCPAKTEGSPLCVGRSPNDGGPSPPDSGLDASEEDGQGTAECKANGQSCVKSSDCCSFDCDPKAKLCGAPPWSCRAAGGDCSTPTECCSLACISGKCGARLCTADQQGCASPAECCSGICTGGKCGALSATCKTSGNPCAQDSDCCSTLCRSGVCNIAPSSSTQNGDVCVTGDECAGGLCTKASGNALGTCATLAVGGAGGCSPAGQLCTGASTCGASCCSRVCEAVSPFGRTACLAPTGCRPTGELCKTDDDCCGSTNVPTGGGSPTVVCSKVAPGDPLGRCASPAACTPAGLACKMQGAVCSAPTNCCVGSVAMNPGACLADANGAARCVVDLAVQSSCAGGGGRPGMPCASSADCCGFICLNNVCGPGSPAAPTCATQGAACTATADCCRGLPCELVAGSSNGGTCGASVAACSLAGQQCAVAADCCSGVACTNGRCHVP